MGNYKEKYALIKGRKCMVENNIFIIATFLTTFNDLLDSKVI